MLQLHTVGLNDFENLDVLDKPSVESILQMESELQRLGAIDDKRAITDRGRRMALLPNTPQMSATVLDADQCGSLAEVQVLAVLDGGRSIFVRPRGKESEAELVHSQFKVAGDCSDLLPKRHAFGELLKVWHRVGEREQDRSRRKAAQEHAVRGAAHRLFLNHKVFFESQQALRQLEEIVLELGLWPNYNPAPPEQIVEPFLRVYGLARVLIKDPSARYADNWKTVGDGKRVTIARESVVHQRLQECTFLLATAWKTTRAGALLATELSEVTGEQMLRVFGDRFRVERSNYRFSQAQQAVVCTEQWYLDGRAVTYSESTLVAAGKEGARVLAQAMLAGAAQVEAFAPARTLLAELRELSLRSVGTVPTLPAVVLEEWVMKATGHAVSVKGAEKRAKRLALTLETLDSLGQNVSFRQLVENARGAYPDVLQLHGVTCAVAYRDNGIAVTVVTADVEQVLPRLTVQDMPTAWTGRQVTVTLGQPGWSTWVRPWTQDGLDHLRRQLAARPHAKPLPVNLTTASKDDMLTTLEVQHPDRLETIYLVAGLQEVYLSEAAALNAGETLIATRMWEASTRPTGELEIANPEDLTDTRELPAVQRFRYGVSPLTGAELFGYLVVAVNHQRWMSGPWFVAACYRLESEAKAAWDEASDKFQQLRREAQQRQDEQRRQTALTEARELFTSLARAVESHSQPLPGLLRHAAEALLQSELSNMDLPALESWIGQAGQHVKTIESWLADEQRRLVAEAAEQVRQAADREREELASILAAPEIGGSVELARSARTVADAALRTALNDMNKALRALEAQLSRSSGHASKVIAGAVAYLRAQGAGEAVVLVVSTPPPVVPQPVPQANPPGAGTSGSQGSSGGPLAGGLKFVHRPDMRTVGKHPKKCPQDCCQ